MTHCNSDETLDEWQLMETAPKDRKLLGYVISRGYFDSAPTYNYDIIRWSGSYFQSRSGAIPIRWQDLPKPPEAV